MSKEPYIVGERIIMRLVGEEDLDAVVDYMIRNKEFLAPFEPLKPDLYYTKEFWKKMIPKSKKDAEDKKGIRLYLFEKENKNRVIGALSFEFIRLKPLYNCIIGYSLDEFSQGKGYMTEAVKLGIEYVFKELNIMRISGGYSPTNERSGNVMKRLGFSGEHLIKKYIMINGKWEDIKFLYLYNDNWKEE